MNISNSTNMPQTPAALSILKAANKQPELALQLLLKSLAGTEASAQTPASRVSASVNSQGTGQIIDIVA